jgi:hypothetical protein
LTEDLNAGPNQVLNSILKNIADDKSISPLGIIEKIPKKRKNLLNNLKPIISLFLLLI